MPGPRCPVSASLALWLQESLRPRVTPFRCGSGTGGTGTGLEVWRNWRGSDLLAPPQEGQPGQPFQTERKGPPGLFDTSGKWLQVPVSWDPTIGASTPP